MNPFSLLQKGHTFRDMGSRHGYKMMEGNTLPNFSKGKRPAPSCASSEPQKVQRTLFEEPAKPADADAETHSAPAPEPEPVKPAATTPLPSPFAQAAVKKDETKPKAHHAARAWKKAAVFCQRQAQRIFFWRKGRPAQRAGVQTELALDKVTVMRNDLNEDDLEVVLVERKEGRGAKPLARLSKMEMTGDAWNRLTAPFRKKGNDSATSPKAETKAPELGARAGTA